MRDGLNPPGLSGVDYRPRGRHPRRRCIDNGKEFHLLALTQELARYFEGNQPAEAMPTQAIGTRFLHRLDRFEHTASDDLYACIRRSLAIQPPISHAVKRLVDAQQPGQLGQVDHVPATAWDKKQRSASIPLLDRDGRRGWSRLLPEHRREGFNSRALEQHRYRQANREISFHFRHQP